MRTSDKKGILEPSKIKIELTLLHVVYLHTILNNDAIEFTLGLIFLKTNLLNNQQQGTVNVCSLQYLQNHRRDIL